MLLAILCFSPCCERFRALFAGNVPEPITFREYSCPELGLVTVIGLGSRPALFRHVRDTLEIGIGRQMHEEIFEQSVGAGVRGHADRSTRSFGLRGRRRHALVSART